MSLTLFSEPKVIFKEIFKELSSAKKSIYIESYILDDDRIGRELIRILAAKSEDITVILIVDGVGFDRLSYRTQKIISSSNISFHIFNPVGGHIKFRRPSVMFKKMQERTHRKLTIIDEKIAFVGGINYSASELSWRDTFVKITGQLVKPLVSSFNEMKNITTKKRFRKRNVDESLSKKFIEDDLVIRQIPRSKHKFIRNELIKLIDTAKTRVYLTTPYFIPEHKFISALHHAVKRGVIVQLIVPEYTDHPIVDVLTNFSVSKAVLQHIDVRISKKMTHAKYIIIDDVVSVGSCNFTYRSFHINYELNILSKDKKLLKQTLTVFNNDWLLAKPFDNKVWLDRSYWHKFIERLLHPKSKYF